MTKLLTPSEVPSEYVCRTIKVPNSLEWLGIFNAVMLTGTYYYNWSDDIDTHMTREEAAAAYTVVFNEWLLASMECDVCVLPAGGSVIQQDEFGRFKMLDGGEWSTPSGDYALPPLNPREEPTDDEKKCAAAANAASVMQQLYEGLADEYADNHDKALFFLAIGVLIAGFFLPPLGLLASGFLSTATILVSEGFGAFAFLTADVWDTDFTDAFKCILLDNASVDGDGVVTFDFDQVRNDVVNALPFTFDDPTLQKPRLALQLGTILQYVGADGLDYAGSTTGITDADCTSCGELWCWNFRSDTNLGDFTSLDFGGIGGEATYDGTKWTSYQFTSPPYGHAVVNINLQWDFASPQQLTFIDFATNVGHMVEIYTSETPGGTETYRGLNLWMDTTPITVQRVRAQRVLVDVTDTYEVLAATFQGIGENPIGDNNCE